jgi:hypothetical protein
MFNHWVQDFLLSYTPPYRQNVGMSRFLLILSGFDSKFRDAVAVAVGYPNGRNRNRSL